MYTIIKTILLFFSHPYVIGVCTKNIITIIIKAIRKIMKVYYTRVHSCWRDIFFFFFV